MVDLGRQTLIHGNKVPVEEMCAKIDSLTLEVRPSFPSSFILFSLLLFFLIYVDATKSQSPADKQDIWRVAMRVLKPTSKSAVLNYGLGAGGPTIVAQGPNLAALGDVKSTLRKWGVGR